MIAILEWTALAVCFVCLVLRLPATIKGRNVSLFWCFALLTVAVGLSIPDVYLPIDGLLGGRNIANLVLRLCLYAICFLLAVKIAAAYQSKVGLRLIRGRIGLLVLAVDVVGTIICFFMSDLPVSRTGLAGYSDQASVVAYTLFGRLYPTYAAAALIWPTFKGGVSARRILDKSAAWLMSLGFMLVPVVAILQLSGHGAGAAIHLASYTAILCVAIGLSLVWLSYARRPARR
jgi:hypothetical protein